MGFISKLFVSKEEALAEARAAQRRVARKLDEALSKMSESINEMRQKTDAFWEKAKVAARCGNLNERNRALMSYQRYSTLVDKQESRLLWLEAKKCDFTTATSLSSAVAALKEFAVAADINPDKFAAEIDAMMDVGANMDDAIKEMDRTVKADENKVGMSATASYVPDAALLAQLEADAIGGAAPVVAAPAAAPAAPANEFDVNAKQIADRVAAFEKK